MLEILTWITSILFTLSGVSDGHFDTQSPSDKSADTTTEAVYPDEVMARVTRVIDGDTIDVSIDGVVERVRYIGIDAPERAECFSTEATTANRALVEGTNVRLVADEERRDDYSRLLRYVYVDTTFVNRELLRTGHARLLFIPPNTRSYGDFLAVRDTARDEQRGLWGMCMTP